MPRRQAATRLPGQRLARWAVLGAVLGGALSLLAFAPARWLADGLARASNGRLLIADTQGTVWRGSGVLVLTGGDGSRDASALPGRLDWRLAPSFSGGAALALHARQACCLNGELALLLRPGLGRLQVELRPQPGWIGQWPSNWLGGLGTPWNTLQLGGQLRLLSPGLSIDSVQGRWRLNGSAELELQGLSSRLSTLPTLGSYRLRLEPDPTGAGGAALQLSTQEGALQLSGTGQWNGARLQLRGEARAASPADEAALGNLLNIIGRRQGARSVISIG